MEPSQQPYNPGQTPGTPAQQPEQPQQPQPGQLPQPTPGQPSEQQQQPVYQQPVQFPQTAYQQSPPAPQPDYGQPSSPDQSLAGQVSDKQYFLALLFSFLFGGFAVDRFYLGHIGTGVAKLLTLGGLGIWSLVDFLLIAFGKLKDKQGRELQGFRQNQKTGKIVAVVIVVLNLLVIVPFILLMTLLSTSALQKNSRDTQTKSDLSLIASEIEVYRSEKRTYPSKQEFDSGKFTDTITAVQLKAEDILYRTTPETCDGTTVPCTAYTLGAKLEDGTTYTIP
jgi:hypothetical protein